MTAYYDAIPDGADEEATVGNDLCRRGQLLRENGFDEPDPADFGVWVPGIPVLIGNGLEAAGAADWLNGLILDGIVAGVGAVLGFVPQMLVLFLMLAFLEACGYMARIAFVLDRIFRKFGLSGKTFIPMLIGTGCGVPGIMASRTIENERDRRMTIMTTTFIPCGAKVPFIAMIAGAIFGGSAWVSTSAYFIGMAAIIISGIMLKKTKMFSGDPAPFVMELPAYHWPTLGNVLRSMWERGWSFIKKAGTIILLSTIFVWFTTYFGWVDGTFRMLDESEIDDFDPRHHRRRDCLDLQAPRLGQLAGRRGLHHRPCRQGEHRRHARHPLWRRRRHRLPEHRCCLHRCDGLQLPRLQPAVRPLLRGNRRDQARDEQRTSGPGSPSPISAASRM